MRFKNRKQAAIAGKQSQKVQAIERMNSDLEIIRRPNQGTLLKTMRITDEIGGKSQEIKILQGPRKNQILVSCFGRVSKPHGWDWFVRNLRKKSVSRWLEV